MGLAVFAGRTIVQEQEVVRNESQHEEGAGLVTIRRRVKPCGLVGREATWGYNLGEKRLRITSGKGKSWIGRGVIAVLAGAAVALVATTCGGKQSSAISSQSRQRQGYGGQASDGRVAPPLQSGGQAIQAADEISLDEALVELGSMECPEGVDEQLWGELKKAQGEALMERASSVGAIHELPFGKKAGRGDPALQHCV